MGPVSTPRAPIQRLVASPSTQHDAWWHDQCKNAAAELHDGRINVTIFSRMSLPWMTATIERHLPGLSSPPWRIGTTQLRAKAYALTALHLLCWADQDFSSPKRRTKLWDAKSYELALEMASTLFVEAQLALRASISTHYVAPVIKTVQARICKAVSTAACATFMCRFSYPKARRRSSGNFNYLSLRIYWERCPQAAAIVHSWWMRHNRTNRHLHHQPLAHVPSP